MPTKIPYKLLFRPGIFNRYKLKFSFILVFVIFNTLVLAEGTKQLEPVGSPATSSCKIVLTRNTAENRIPFALLNCGEEFRLNVRIRNFATEKIYIGFGAVIDYFDDAIIYTDVEYQLKDPAGNVVASQSLRPVPDSPSEAGFINTRNQAVAGPDINNSNPAGYDPVSITPYMNGDYVLEFNIANALETEMRIFKYFDVTVANGNNSLPGRLWSKAWQLSSSSIYSETNSTFTSFYIYSNDSIVTKFNCNGLAGGVWAIYSNEWGCSTTGTWSDRRKSIEGNATVQPQHRIFLDDPDELSFPSGMIGELLNFEVLPYTCDTVITFAAEVSKKGNIEILIDVPPLNPNSTGPEDVQLGYSVTAGNNILLPGWDGRNAYGTPLPDGTQVEARIRFLNGLSNVPLYDVEDNPGGFKVDIQRPAPVAASKKLELFWDDTRIPPYNPAASNTSDGCLYTGNTPVSGCHEWSRISTLGDSGTINSWWYYSSGSALTIPITLKLRPGSGQITGPSTICEGQVAVFQTSVIPFALKYTWHVTGPGISYFADKFGTDTSFSQLFAEPMLQGMYLISVWGWNACGDGDSVSFSAYFSGNQVIPVIGNSSGCTNAIIQYQIPGSYLSVLWSTTKGSIIGSQGANPVAIRWYAPGNDTINVQLTDECGTRLSRLPVTIYPVARAEFSASTEYTSCPGLPVSFADSSVLSPGTIASRLWNWSDGNTHSGNDSLVSHSYSTEGDYNVILTVTTNQGCETKAEHEIHIIPFPVAEFSWYRNCLSDSLKLIDNSTGIDLNSWIWDPGFSQTSTANLTIQEPSVIYHKAGQFPVSLIVENKYGCRDTAVRLVTIHHPPVADFSHELACSESKIMFTDKSTPADTALTQYSWWVNPDDKQIYFGNPATIMLGKQGEYQVNHIVKDLFGCSDTSSATLTVYPKPDCSFTYSIEPGNGLLHFENLTTGASEYFWDFGNNSTSDSRQTEVSYLIEGEYTIQLIAKSPEGCADTAIQLYHYMPGLWLPNAFKPDNKQQNNVFRPVTQRNTLDPFLLQIYSRWGQLIFSTTDPETGWDGTNHGDPCPSDVYYYLIKYNTGNQESSEISTKRGTVTLIR